MSTQNSEKPQTTVSARRRLLQIVAVGGTAAVVLPAKWVKPVVDSVMVPAHAAGSVPPPFGIFGNQGTLFADSGQGNFLERVAGMLSGSAHAIVFPTCGLANNSCISFNIPALPSTTVSVMGDNHSNSAVIHPNNYISNVTVGSLSFTNLFATTTNVIGDIDSPNCATEHFTFPRRTGNSCAG